MTEVNSDSEKEREERKRDAAYDPVLRWQHIQDTITWAEANMPPHLRRNRPRWPKCQDAPSVVVELDTPDPSGG
jgi:hypothetical protein